MKNAFFTPDPTASLSAAPGFGLLRVDPHSPAHSAAVKSAAQAGVRLFDLGWFQEENAGARLRLLAETFHVDPEKTASENIHLLLRGNLGDASQLPEFFLRSSEVSADFLNRVQWTYLISDPEFSLSDFDGEHEKLYGALEEEFSVLEMLIRDGQIRDYGIGSAAFTYSKEDPQYLSLEALLSAERGAGISANTGIPARGPSHTYPGFRAVEFPLNLYESAATQFENQTLGDENVSLLEAAKAHGLTTYARRPLDAVTDTQLLRLTAYPDHHRLDLDGAVMGTFAVALEREIAIGSFIEETKVAAWAHRLRDQLRHVNDPEHWKEIRARKITPDLEKLKALVTHPSAQEALTAYLQGMEALLLAVQLWCEKRGAERNERLRAKIVSAVPALRGTRGGKPRTLPDTAFLVYRSVPHLDYVLSGMRSVAHVESTLENFRSTDPLLSAEELRLAFEAAHAAIHSLTDSPSGESQPESPTTH